MTEIAYKDRILHQLSGKPRGDYLITLAEDPNYNGVAPDQEFGIRLDWLGEEADDLMYNVSPKLYELTPGFDTEAELIALLVWQPGRCTELQLKDTGCVHYDHNLDSIDHFVTHIKLLHRMVTMATQPGTPNDLFHALMAARPDQVPTRYAAKQDLFADLDPETDEPVELLVEAVNRGFTAEHVAYTVIAPCWAPHFTEGQYWTLKSVWDALQDEPIWTILDDLETYAAIEAITDELFDGPDCD